MTDGEWGIRRVVTRRVWLVGACSAPLGLVWSRRAAACVRLCLLASLFGSSSRVSLFGSSSRVGVDDSGREVGKAAREGEMRLV